MENEAIQPGRWRHFKGKEYQVLGMARHSETLEQLVVYRALYGEGGLWVRPRPCGWRPWTGTDTAGPGSCGSETEP